MTSAPALRILVIVAGVLAAPAIGSATLSDAMSLPAIERALQVHPPALGPNENRAKIAASLDRLVRVRVRDAMTDDERSDLKPLVEFYRRQVDRGLDALERTTVTNGVHVFKFYSSSIVLKSSEGVVAIDFAQGPIHNGGEPEQRDSRRTGFYMTPMQRDRLARLVDVSLITHRHQGGENHVPAGDWLRRSAVLGFRPDLRGSSGQFQGGRSIDAVLKELGPGMLLPRHEYEMTHEAGGNRMTPLFTGNGGKALAARQSLVLFWGEHFPITHSDFPVNR